jgi:hypothetical protein
MQISTEAEEVRTGALSGADERHMQIRNQTDEDEQTRRKIRRK